MTWFRVDDTLAAHPKTRRAGLAAMGLWTVAGSWSSQQLTEGFVPTWFVETWPQGKKLAAQLVRAGYWETAEIEDEQGWQFHDWTDANPTAEKEKDRRRKARERQRKLREKSAEKREEALDKALEASVSRVTSRVTDAVSHGAPSRPDPIPTSTSKTSGGNVQEVDARDADEPPRCSQHKGMRREDVPSCWACGHKREQWEATRSADDVFERPAWCGHCDQFTRKVEIEIEGRDAMQNCPTCHPLAVAS